MPPNGVGRLLWQCPWVGEEGTQCTGAGHSPEEVLIIQDTTPSWQQEGKQITCRMWACEGRQIRCKFRFPPVFSVEEAAMCSGVGGFSGGEWRCNERGRYSRTRRIEKRMAQEIGHLGAHGNAPQTSDIHQAP